MTDSATPHPARGTAAPETELDGDRREGDPGPADGPGLADQPGPADGPGPAGPTGDAGEPDAASEDTDATADPLDGMPIGPFGPVPLRYRRDGWVPDRQLAFIEALADSGCVEDAARAVGMSRNAAYALRRRSDAQAFRLAWDAAMDSAVTRLADAAMSRAIHGVAVPIFHGGDQVGERRHFDERLTMFLLRYRDPEHYGKWLDRTEVRQHRDGPAVILSFRIARMLRAAWRAFDAAWRDEPVPTPAQEIIPPERYDPHADPLG